MYGLIPDASCLSQAPGPYYPEPFIYYICKYLLGEMEVASS